MAVTAVAVPQSPSTAALIVATVVVEGGALLVASQIPGPLGKVVRIGAAAAVPPVARWLSDTLGL